MAIFVPFLNAAGVVILDGGLASELERRGADLRDPLWSAKLLIENPELIRQVHEDYFRAGADVGTSASYQASFLGFARRGLSPKQAGELMRLSVQLVRDARDRFWDSPDRPADRLRPLIAASIGCYGATLADGAEYRGDYDLTADEMIDWHRPRLETLLEETPDVLACETIPCLAEVEALTRLLGEFPQTPAWLGVCCRDERHLSSGEPYAEAIAIANSADNVVAVGVNCTSPAFVPALVAAASQNTHKQIVVYPNRGEEWDAEKKTWDNRPVSSSWSDGGPLWRAAGATLIGGCCRTTPEDIRRLRSSLCGNG